ncbi:polyprotein [Cucumis melo var. makuwa]|uniref:Polyprotein n=1 Tax=Cucumis melo var. makuwa TaxID=1194695 RepID=A0A5A7SKD3_CUCMM|nr:polyprotein [Cucumis melo var. makuwa]TYK11621.1 polyprotein [Cucumis melo var. makuwa]
MYNTQETTKLDLKARRCLFLGYADGEKDRLWDPTAHKVIISRDVIFMEDKKQVADDSTVDESSGTAIVHVEKESVDDSFEVKPMHEIQEPAEQQVLEIRRSGRTTSPHVGNLMDEAMQEEIEVLHNNKTWELVTLPQGRKPIGNKWVYKIKRNNDDQVEQYHARLVVKGYAHKEDVKTAFLHGDLEEEIYILQPKGFEVKGKENLVCRLNKSLYGLKQAPRCWYKRFDSFILSLGYNRLNADPCAYFKRFGEKDFIVLLLYVDDMLVAGPNKNRIEELKAYLAKEFEMKNLGPGNKILGMKIHRDRNNRKIWLSQKDYLKKVLRRFNMQDLESLMFAMICTRPDIAHAMGVVSRYMVNPGQEHLNIVKRILRYIKGSIDVVLCYGGTDFTIRGYVDFNYAGDLDKSKSTTGYVFTLASGAVSWVSKLQSVVAMSTTEAEYVAATQASKEAVWLKKILLEELGHEHKKISLFCDNQSALYLARNPAFHAKTKHIRVQYHFVREEVEEEIIDMHKIHTKENLVDYLTRQSTLTSSFDVDPIMA